MTTIPNPSRHPSTLCGHGRRSALRDSIAPRPEARNSLGLRIKVQSGLAIESKAPATSYTLLTPGEAKHGKRNWYRHIDAQLSRLGVLAEPLGRGARAGEDRDAVAVLVAVDEGDGVVKGGNACADEHRAEYFLTVTGHVRFYVCYYCGADLWGDLSVR